MKATIQDTFERLKPLCAGLGKQCTVENLNRLQCECQDLDDVSLQIFQQYLVFPVRLALKKQFDEKFNIEGIKFMTRVFRKTKLVSWSVVQDILAQIFLFISGPENAGLPRAISEELKLAICVCAEAIVIHSTAEVLTNMYSAKFCLPLAQYIYGLIELLRTESSKQLRLASLRTLATLLYCSNKLSKSDSLITAAGDRTAAFLPGVSVAFRDIICGDVKQGHAIVVLALETLSAFVAMVVGDIHVNENTKKEEDLKTKTPLVVRNLKWVKEMSHNLEIIILQVVGIVSHEHWKVRLALVNFANHLLCSCSNNLSNCISPLLQVLFTLNVDEYEQVAVASNKALEKFSRHINCVKSFNSILEEDIFNISSKLIKVHLSTNDIQKLALLKMLHGYFHLLGSSVNNLLYSLPHLEKFLISMLNLITFDYSDLTFFADHVSVSNFDADLPQLWPKHRFKYFHDDEIATRIISVCQVLGFNGDINLLVDSLLEKHRSSSYKNEAVFMLNNIIKGLDIKTFPLQTDFKDSSCETKVSNVDHECKIHIITEILESLLSSEVWTIPFNNYCDNSSSESPESCKENILQVCLILECIATCCQILKHDFHPFLMEVLCPVMEKAGCGNLMLSHTAKLTLQCIADSNGYSSISNLIIQNADYLVNSICTKLYRFISESETFLVLQVIVEYCDSDILHLFKDPIDDLFKTLDLHQEKALPIMRVLKSIVLAVKRWFPFVENVTKKKWVKHEVPKAANSSLKSLYLEHHHLKKQEMSFLDEEDSKQNESKEDTGEEPVEIKDDATPLHVEIVTQVLDRCVHMMSSNSLELTSLILETIGVCILALKSDIDKALPYVHKVWSPLVLRFSGNLVVCIKAFETLVIIANECGDFIKARTMKQVWPKFISFLKSQVVLSLTKSNSADYCMTTSYKYQLLLLSEIGHLAKKLDLTEQETEMLASCCLPYLNKNQPIPLQEATKSSLNDLSSVDSDALWFHFHELFGIAEEIIPPNPELRPVHFALAECDVTGNYCVP